MLRNKCSHKSSNEKNASRVLRFWRPWFCVFRIFWFGLLALTSQSTFAATVPAGDLAPYGAPDGQVNVADVLILQRFVLGDLTPTPYEIKTGDVAPFNNPDGILNTADILILQRAVLGEIILSDIVFVVPTAPILDTPVSPVNSYQILITGITDPDLQVNLYQEGVLQTSTIALADGSFGFTVTLVEGANSFYVTAFEYLEFQSDPSNTINITLDITPPAPVTTTDITVSAVVGGIVTVSGAAGSVEGSSIVILTNPRTGESVSITTNADGSFTANIAAREGDDITISTTDTAGNTSATRYTTAPGIPPALAITIDYPRSNKRLADTRIPVYGTFVAPANTIISVNGKIANIKGSEFYVNNIPLISGDNTLDVTAVTSDGTTVTETIGVKSTADTLVLVEASPDTGIAPLTVSFDLTNNTGNTITSITVDADNDGTPDLTATDLLALLEYTYNVPGVYTALITIDDSLGNTYTSTQFIVVQGIAETSNQLQAVYTGFLEQLRVGNVAGAMAYLTPAMKSKYETKLGALSLTTLATVTDQLGAIAGGGVSDELASYTIFRKAGGVTNAYQIFLIKGEDGIWRIGEM